MDQQNKNIILQLKNFSIKGDNIIIDNSDLQIKQSEINAIYGDSGTGKSLTAMAIMGMKNYYRNIEFSGEIIFDNSIDILKAKEEELNDIRGNRISMIYQDSLSSYNPNKKCKIQFEEILKSNKVNPTISILKESLNKVNLNYNKLNLYPWQLSGGELQRLSIAIAISVNSEIIICDEPTTNLDPILKTEIINLIEKINKSFGITFIIISHDRKSIDKISTNSIELRNNKFQKYIQYTFETPEKNNHSPKSYNYDSQEYELEIKNINKTFKSNFNLWKFKYKNSTKALENVSLSLKKGHILGITGNSGSGKTTLARIISGLENADSGEIIISGNINKNQSSLRSSTNIQYVFQNPITALNRIVRIKYLLNEALKKSGNYNTNSLEKILLEFGIKEEILERYSDQISGGEAQRIAIARSLIVNPQILILDESFSSLDHKSQYNLMELILNYRLNHRLSIILITHDIEFAKLYCDNIINMKDGKIT
ncbi:MAG: ATP-binding cassette domain-containing protein [Saprospiraceae bacterium]